MFFKLEGKIGVQITSSEYFELALAANELSVTIKRTTFDSADVYVSTIFLGLCPVTPGEPPQLFETMIFGGPRVSENRRKYSDYDAALKGHRELCRLIAKEMVASPGPWLKENNRSTPEPNEPQDEEDGLEP